MPSNKGRCVSCGFLGKQDRRQDTSSRYPGIYEVEWLERADPSKARKSVHQFANASMPTELICYRGAALAVASALPFLGFPHTPDSRQVI